MMENKYSLGEIISQCLEEEFSVPDDFQLPQLSSNHNRKMHRIFRKFEKKKHSRVSKPVSLKKQVAFVLVAAVCLTLTAVMAVAFSMGYNHSHTYEAVMYGEPYYIRTTHQHPLVYKENGVEKYIYVECKITTTVYQLRQTCIHCGSRLEGFTSTASEHSVHQIKGGNR